MDLTNNRWLVSVCDSNLLGYNWQGFAYGMVIGMNVGPM